MLKDLITVSQHYGANPEFVIAGGGNTSFKNESNIWIKASGISLKTIDEKGFVCLSREKLKIVEEKTYSPDPLLREQQVKADLMAAVVESSLRPSVETSLHNIIDYAYVVHTHPTKLNALLCSNSAKLMITKLYGDDALFIAYTDPGYILFKKVLQEIKQYRQAYGKNPQLIFLENHGVFVAADTIQEIRDLYERIMKKVEPPAGMNFTFSVIQNGKLQGISDLSLLREYVVLAFSGELITKYITKQEYFSRIDTPFTPDQIVYCKSKYLYLESLEDPGFLADAIISFRNRYGYIPKVIAIGNFGLITVGDTERSSYTVFEVFFDMIKIRRLSDFYGGPKFMTPEQIAFIDTWEVENYRRTIALK